MVGGKDADRQEKRDKGFPRTRAGCCHNKWLKSMSAVQDNRRTAAGRKILNGVTCQVNSKNSHLHL